MRNFFKPTTRGDSTRSRRPLRGVAAAVASVALVAGLGSYPGDAVAQETTTSTTTEVTATETTSEQVTPTPKVMTSQPVTVDRSGNVDHIVVDDTDVNVWDSGRKASDEDIIALKRTGGGTIEEIIKIVADGKVLDPQNYGFVNDENGGYIAVDLDGLNVTPPMHIEYDVRTTKSADYDVAESGEVPTARELSASGFGKTENAGATVDPDGVGTVRAAPPGDIYELPGWKDQELNVSKPSLTTVNNNPELKFTVNESGDWQMTRFAIKKDQNSSNTRPITGPVRVRVIRNGKTVVDRKIEELNEYTWGNNGAPHNVSNNTEFQLVPTTTDLYFKGGDTIILNPQGPPNGTYQVQLWGRTGETKPGCGSESAIQTPLPPREISEAEKASGTRKFVSTSEDASGGTGDRGKMVRTVLNLQDQGLGSFRQLGKSNWIYNALAYNPDDNWLYAVSQFRGDQPGCYPSAHLLQIDPTNGSVRNLGPLTGVTLPRESETRNNDRDLLNSGVIHNGTLYVSNSATSGTRQMYKIPLPGSAGFQTGLPSIEKMTFNGSPTLARSEDYAQIRADEKYAWGLVSKYAFDPAWKLDGAKDIVMERINLETGETAYYIIKGARATAVNGQKLEQQTTWGKAWTYGNGNLGFGVGGQSSAGYSTVQISIVNPDNPVIRVEQLLPKAPFSYNTDAASDGLRNPVPKSDLKITKKTITPDDPDWAQLSQLRDFNEYSTYWKVVMKNGNSFNSGSTLREYLPATYDPDSFQLVGTSASPGQSQEIYNPKNYSRNDNGSVFQIGMPVMPANSTLTTYWRAKAYTPNAFDPNRQFAAQGCASNGVELINNDEEGNPGDNSSEAGCPLDFGINKVDASGGKTPLTGAEFVLFNVGSETGEVAPAGENDLDRGTWENNKKVIQLAEGTGNAKGTYKPVKQLEPGTPYRLYETRSPLGADGRRYRLLLAPVVFRVKAEQGPKYSLEFYDEEKKTWSANTPVEVAGIDIVGNKVTMSVANVLQGDLPKTGGRGVGVTTAIGLLIAAAGALMANNRRRV
ncbi:DUF6923 family protein [Corynebacterium sp. 20_84]